MLKKYISYALIVVVAATLMFAYFHGSEPEVAVETSEKVQNVATTETVDTTKACDNQEEMSVKKEEFTPVAENKVTEKTETVIQSEAIPENEETDELYCYLSVECGEILNNIHLLPEEKHCVLPQNGIVFPETRVLFNEGESVFHVLRRELKRAKIHLEFTMTPLFNSAYIEGINNLYEFDCGEQSGWLYSVNGEFPNYGCSGYTLKKGDKVNWVYTVSFGRDVGGYYMEGEETVENDI